MLQQPIMLSNKRRPPMAIDSINKLRNVQIFGQMDDAIMNDCLAGQITAYLIFVNCGTPPHYLDL